MSNIRPVKDVLSSRPTVEGAGVRLLRVFGFSEVPRFDPFLLLDHFGSDDPEDYLAGFPWHPHRGIETVTYMIDGAVEHGDSIGNSGTIGSGDVQWMTAGGGIIHQEMPRRFEGTSMGFQLWVNLPASHKMMEPRYRSITSREIPQVERADGVRIMVIRGEVDGVAGPVKDIIVDVRYLDVSLPPGTMLDIDVPPSHNAFAYVFEGRGAFGEDEDEQVAAKHLAHFGRGDRVRATASGSPFRFLLVSGEPIGEPVAWRGPIVMNTDEELETAFREYGEGTFIWRG